MPETLEAIFKYKQPEHGSVVPSLFIGLGGAGGKLVDRIIAKFSDRWDSNKFRGLYHAFAIDTDQGALATLTQVPKSNRVLISDFDKRTYAAKKRGDTYITADPHVTSWVHPWYGFRSESGAGAGQIRIESRLCVHYQLEEDRAGLVRSLREAFNDILSHNNPFRRRSPASVNVFIYGSVAGGTGSGAMVAMSYLARTLANDKGLTPHVYGHVVLPGPFIDEVAHAQRDEIDANGYAALKEIEHLMGVGVEASGRPKQLPFRFSGFHPKMTSVDKPPFDFVYLLDVPARMNAGGINELRNAVADAMFIQFASPVLRSQNSNWDNMVKLVQGGTGQDFSLKYGTYGASALVLPDRDILEYCARRLAIEQIDQLVLQRPGKSGDAVDVVLREAAAELDTPEFELLSREEQAKRRDAVFLKVVARFADDETRQNRPGPWSVTRSNEAPTTKEPLATIVNRWLSDAMTDVFAAIRIDRLDPADLTEHHRDLHGKMKHLRDQLETSERALKMALEGPIQRIAEGDTLRGIFEDYRVTPLGQRHFLIALAETLLAELKSLRLASATKPDFSENRVGTQVSDYHAELEKTAPLTLLERLFHGSRNKDFHAAREASSDWFNARASEADAHLRVSAEERLKAALLQRTHVLLGTFRDLDSEVRVRRQRLESECRQILADGGVKTTDSLSNLYTLDVEVLRDDATGHRLWDRFYDNELRKTVGAIVNDATLAQMNMAFERILDNNRRVDPDARKVAERITEGFVTEARRKLGPQIIGRDPLDNNRENLGLLIDDALTLEARLVLGLHNNGQVAVEDVRKYIVRKLALVASKAEFLCGISGLTHEEVRPDKFQLVCAHPVYRGDNGLGADIATAVRHEGFSSTHHGWDDAKTVFFYQARLGMPVYWATSVNGRMKDAYHKVQATSVKAKKYPVHIDAAWEFSLPDLDPEGRIAAAESRKAEEPHILFALLLAAGAVSERDTSLFLQLPERPELSLGTTIDNAINALGNLQDHQLATIHAHVDDTRRWLEGPDEPQEAWETIGNMLKKLAAKAFNLSKNDALFKHWDIISTWFRNFAPETAVAKWGVHLAPARDAQPGGNR